MKVGTIYPSASKTFSSSVTDVMSYTLAVLVLVSFVVLETSVLINIYFNAVFPQTSDDKPTSWETQRLFASYDTNGDEVIDLWEFEAVKQRIDEALPTETQVLLNDGEIDRKFEELKKATGEILDLKAEFTPLVLDSMTKFNNGQTSSEDMRSLTGLKQWQEAFKPEASFSVEVFKTFLPKRLNVNLGEPWMIVTPDVSRFGPDLSSNRYTPPKVFGDQIVIHYLLQMFHPRPFMYSRFPPQGTVACIRAENNKFLEVEFRIHAEFQLNRPPLFPFWFSPAQFCGRLVISRDGSHIQSFEMEVPNNKSLNVDMEWLTGKKVESREGEANMEVDIGYLPKMKLQSTGPSYKPGEETIAKDDKHVSWDKQISQEEARNILGEKMYPFKEVPYLSFDKAYAKAKDENKLVHSILLWGSLDDQSC